MNWAEFFHMGGYAYYVWPSWGLTFVVLLWQWLQPKLKRKRLIKQLARQISREQLKASTNSEPTTATNAAASATSTNNAKL